MKLYAFGSNGAGQLGLSHRNDVSIPQECTTDSTQVETPIRVTAGGNHSLILCSSGTLYAAGSLDPSKEAHNSSILASSKTTPVRTPNDFGKIKLCSSTWSTATIIDEKNNVITWGSGNKGELGRGRGVDYVMTPGEPFRFTGESEPEVSIVDLAGSVYHTVAVLSNGDVYGWGNGRKGQLGHQAEIVWQPRKINVDFRVLRAVCGREFTYLIGDTAIGKHKVLGANKWGIHTQISETCLGWSDIGASWSNIFILKKDGTVISWGRNDHGQLSPSTLPPIKQIAVGSEHVLALTDDNTILAWGWGEHGNCGPETERDDGGGSAYNEIVVKDIDLRKVAIGLGAGCATSWIWIVDKL